MSGASAILLSVLSAIISGTVVAFFSPRFAHSVWKKQKLREQQVAVAERFEKLFSDLHIAGNIKPKPPTQGVADERLLTIMSRFFELEALFVLMFVLFEHKETLLCGKKLFRSMRSESRDIEALYAQRAEFLANMFAEALGIPLEKIAKRTTEWNVDEDSVGEK